MKIQQQSHPYNVTQLVSWMFTFIRDYGYKVLFGRMEIILIPYVSIKQFNLIGMETRLQVDKQKH